MVNGCCRTVGFSNESSLVHANLWSLNIGMPPCSGGGGITPCGSGMPPCGSGGGCGGGGFGSLLCGYA